jgi:probable rRNA maturation factor
VASLKKQDRVNIFFTDDVEIKRLKTRHFGIRRVTDVISFPLEDPLTGTLGDIVISLDSAIRQAKTRKAPLHRELLLLAVHGVLHLQGVRDDSEVHWRKMRIAEFEIMVRIL